MYAGKNKTVDIYTIRLLCKWTLRDPDFKAICHITSARDMCKNIQRYSLYGNDFIHLGHYMKYGLGRGHQHKIVILGYYKDLLYEDGVYKVAHIHYEQCVLRFDVRPNICVRKGCFCNLNTDHLYAPFFYNWMDFTAYLVVRYKSEQQCAGKELYTNHLIK